MCMYVFCVWAGLYGDFSVYVRMSCVWAGLYGNFSVYVRMSCVWAGLYGNCRVGRTGFNAFKCVVMCAWCGGM